MDILVYGNDTPHSLGKACTRGFEELGHSVSYFPRSYPSSLLERALNRFEVTNRSLVWAQRNAFVIHASRVNPDLIFIIKGYRLDQRTISRMASTTCATVVNWNPDNPYQIRSTRQRADTYLGALSEYDIVYIWGEFLIDDLRDEGATDVRFLPFAHDPAIHLQGDTVDKYDCDVIFIGHWSEKRERLLSHLQGLNLQIWGPAWKRNLTTRGLEEYVEGGSLSGAEYSRALSSAAIGINVLGDQAKSAHNMRTFEVPATGSLLLTTRTAGQEQFFPENEAAVMYDDGDELREKVEYYLSHDDERRRIAERGYEIVQDHTYASRMFDVISHVEESLR